MPKNQYEPNDAYTKEDWDAVSDNPLWTDEDLKAARPFAEALPELAEAIRRSGQDRAKEAISIRLDQDLVDRLRKSGPGWQSRVNDAIRAWLEQKVA